MIHSRWFRLVVIVVLMVAGGLFLWQYNQVDKPQLVNSDGRVFEKARVVDIVRDNLQEDGSRVGDQIVTLRVILLSLFASKNCSIVFYHILISHNSCFRKFYSHSLPVCIIHIYMVIVDECHKFCTLTVCFYRPRFVAIIEYKFKSFVRGFISNGVPVFVCFY